MLKYIVIQIPLELRPRSRHFMSMPTQGGFFTSIPSSFMLAADSQSLTKFKMVLFNKSKVLKYPVTLIKTNSRCVFHTCRNPGIGTTG